MRKASSYSPAAARSLRHPLRSFRRAEPFTAFPRSRGEEHSPAITKIGTKIGAARAIAIAYMRELKPYDDHSTPDTSFGATPSRVSARCNRSIKTSRHFDRSALHSPLLASLHSSLMTTRHPFEPA